MTQEDRILFHLRNKGGITPLDALNEYGCFRLGARISDLRTAGHDIKTIMITDARNGKRYAKYVLEVQNV